jgi:hypothetical protein
MTTLLYEELLARSWNENVPYASGYLVNGLMARDAADAAAIRARHAEMHAQAEARREAARHPHIGSMTPDGMIWRVDIDEGELSYRVARHTVDQGRVTLHLGTSAGTTLTKPRDPHILVRAACRWIAERRTSILTADERDAHEMIRALEHGVIRGHPLPSAPPSLLRGAETAAGAITLTSLLTPGWSVWSNADAVRSAEMRDEARDGGVILAVSQHDTGRIFTVLREGVAPMHGGICGLAVGHVHERDVHRCDVDDCWSCPKHHRSERRLFRRCHFACVSRSGRRGQLQPAEAVLLNAATLLLGQVA